MGEGEFAFLFPFLLATVMKSSPVIVSSETLDPQSISFEEARDEGLLIAQDDAGEAGGGELTDGVGEQRAGELAGIGDLDLDLVSGRERELERSLVRRWPAASLWAMEWRGNADALPAL